MQAYHQARQYDSARSASLHKSEQLNKEAILLPAQRCCLMDESQRSHRETSTPQPSQPVQQAEVQHSHHDQRSVNVYTNPLLSTRSRKASQVCRGRISCQKLQNFKQLLAEIVFHRAKVEWSRAFGFIAYPEHSLSRRFIICPY